MARIGRRLAMAAVGAALLAFYLLAVYSGVLLAAAAWRTRPPFPTTLGLIVALTLGFGYLSYRVGVARMLAGLDAVEVPRQRAPGIHRRLDDLAAAMDVERPRLLLGRLGAPNALVVGGGDPVVVVDRSLVRLLTADELETILAHELAHLESRDAFVQTLGYAALRTVAELVLLALFPLLLLLTGVARALAWIAGRPGAWPATPTGQARLAIERGVAVVLAALTLLVLAHSRRREFAADARAAEVTGRPIALARALRKIERAATPLWSLLSPLYTHTDTGTGDEDDDEGLLRLFSTHPTTDERIERIRERADAGSDRTGGAHGRPTDPGPVTAPAPPPVPLYVSPRRTATSTTVSDPSAAVSTVTATVSDSRLTTPRRHPTIRRRLPAGSSLALLLGANGRSSEELQ